MTDSTRLDGQVAIVTGGARGIGKGISKVLSEAGAKIVVGDVLDSSSTIKEIEDDGGHAVSMVMDTSKSEDARALVELALERFGELDILVNNAALDRLEGNAWDLADEDWQRTIDVNLGGVFFCSRAALKPMLEAGSGSIVNISSHAALMGREGGSPAYNASKGGVIGLTMAFSGHVSSKGVRVNAIMPGLVESWENEFTDEERAARMTEYPLGFGTPRDIGEAVRYLSCPAAKWVSGTVLRLNGGYQRSNTWL